MKSSSPLFVFLLNVGKLIGLKVSGLKVITGEDRRRRRHGHHRFNIQARENLHITISSIILKIFTPQWDLSPGHRGEGVRGGTGGEEKASSCCSVCVYFPGGLSSLLPDLMCVVLHGRGYLCVYSIQYSQPPACGAAAINTQLRLMELLFLFC